MMPKVSIIVPVYNADKYLRECLDSVVAQSFVDWECILVDDGSKDNSPAICDEYAAKDKRFRVIHQQNAGPSKARNAGLDVAQGEWISFIDADDWIDEGYFDEILEYPSADIIYFGFKRIKEEQVEYFQIRKHSYLTSNNLGVEYAELFDSRIQFFGYTWNKFFKRSIIDANNVRFPDNLVHKEDEVFTFRYSHFVKSMVLSEKTLYNYRINAESVTHVSTFFFDFTKLANYMESELARSPLVALNDVIRKRLFSYRLGAIKEDSEKGEFDSAYRTCINFVRQNKDVATLKWKILCSLPIWCSKLIYNFKYS